MEGPTIQVVVVDGRPVWEVRLGLSVFRHCDRWQAEVVAHSWAAQIAGPPVVVDGDGGRFGEGGL